MIYLSLFYKSYSALHLKDLNSLHTKMLCVVNRILHKTSLVRCMPVQIHINYLWYFFSHNLSLHVLLRLLLFSIESSVQCMAT